MNIKGYCIRCDPSLLVPRLICLHYFRIEAVQHYVLVLTEFLEAVESGYICLGSSDLTVLFQLDNVALHVVKQ